jgi:hypothetical protein
MEAERPGLRVLIVSGYSIERLQPNGLPRTNYAVLAKPFVPAALASTIRTLLAG